MTNRVRVPGTVRELPKSLSGIYRNACPGITEIRVREFAKPAASEQETTARACANSLSATSARASAAARAARNLASSEAASDMTNIYQPEPRSTNKNRLPGVN